MTSPDFEAAWFSTMLDERSEARGEPVVIHRE